MPYYQAFVWREYTRKRERGQGPGWKKLDKLFNECIGNDSLVGLAAWEMLRSRKIKKSPWYEWMIHVATPKQQKDIEDQIDDWTTRKLDIICNLV
jgi:hypothetical protein